MKSLPLFLLSLCLLYQVESEKDGFYNATELKTALTSAGLVCQSAKYDYNVISSENYPIATIRSQKIGFPSLKNILILGGVHGCLTAAASVISIASNICSGLKYSADWKHLLNTFQIRIVPSYFGTLYNLSYDLKKSNENDQIVKYLKDEKECKDPDKNINEKDKSGCSNDESISNFRTFIEDYSLIINIQGDESNYNSKTDVSDIQKYIYELVLNTRPKKSSGSLVNKILSNDSSFIFQYSHKLLKEIDRKKINELYSTKFDDIFTSLGDNFPPPNITFFNATENESPSEKKPSTVTFMYGFYNSYPFDIVADVTINITINENDVYRILDNTSDSQIAQFNLYEENSDVKYNVFYAELSSQAHYEKQDAISSYQVNMKKLPVPALSFKAIKIKYTRKLGGQIKFDIHGWLNSTGENYFTMEEEYKLNGQYVWVVPKDDDKDSAPRSIVLFLMFLIFIIIILVIACSVLVKSKPKRLLG